MKLPLTSAALGVLQRFARRLRSSHLLMLVTALFALDMVTPDLIPWVDEIVLFGIMLLVDRWQARREPPPEEDDLEAKPPPKNVTPK